MARIRKGSLRVRTVSVLGMRRKRRMYWGLGAARLSHRVAVDIRSLRRDGKGERRGRGNRERKEGPRVRFTSVEPQPEYASWDGRREERGERRAGERAGKRHGTQREGTV